MNNTPLSVSHKQCGAALFMALVFLLIMTILGVFGMNLSRMENLMAGNNQFQALALNHAELMLDAGIREIEGNLGDGITVELDDAGDHLYLNNTDSSEIIDPTALNWTFNTVSTTPPGGNANYSYDYVIEYIGELVEVDAGLCSSAGFDGRRPDDCYRHIYLVSSQSVTSRGAKRIIQSVFVSGEQM